MTHTVKGIDYETALANLRRAEPQLNGTLPEKEVLLKTFHPDYAPSAHTTLSVGVNAGDSCHPDLAKLLTAHALIEDYDLAGAESMRTDVLVIGGGGAGAAAALTAHRRQQYRDGRGRHSGCRGRRRQLATPL